MFGRPRKLCFAEAPVLKESLCRHQGKQQLEQKVGVIQLYCRESHVLGGSASFGSGIPRVGCLQR